MYRPVLPRAAALVLALAFAGGCVGPGVRVHRQEVVEVGAPGATRALGLLVWHPPGYDAPGRETERWPLVVFLHGLFAEGSDPDSVTRDGLPALLERGFAPPAVVVSPQLWAFAQRWNPRLLGRVMDYVVAHHRVDPTRVVVVGISSGATTGWDAVAACPRSYAGLVVISGWTSSRSAIRLRDVPVWAFYAGLDPIAPAPLAAGGVRALQAAGGRARLTVVGAGTHWFTQDVLARDDLWRWILERRRTPE